MLVIDASVLVTALVGEGRHGSTARERLQGEVLAAPDLIDLEMASVLRRLTLAGALTVQRASQALDDLADLPLQRSPHLPFLMRCWELRADLTAYDAAYVALAEALDVILLTADARLARAPGPRCPIELLGVDARD